MTDQDYMQKAIEIGQKGMRIGAGGPFGAIVVRNGEILSEAHNGVFAHNDPTAHAEVQAIRAACQKIDHYQLEGATLYTTCEPCPMCLGAIYWARPDRVVYACTRDDAAEAGFDDAFIYRELLLPLEQRTIPLTHLDKNQALTLFEEWRDMEKPHLY
ncbi:MAG: nucleoside deaminase [Saprospiraceae bacterium]|jgi:tRNA(Arg) A34 adenosine deaminase TadA